MSAMPLVHVDPYRVAVRLSRLGLRTDVLRESVLAGGIARSACTENMPPGFPGVAAWAYTVAELRNRLMPEGWTRSNAGNYPTVVNPEGVFAIGVATGNEHTASPFYSPKTKFPKGPATIDAVEHNGDYDLFGNPIVVKTTKPAADRLLWLLLIASAAGRINCELSRPAGMGEDGRVDSWAERILLPAVDFDDDGRGLSLPEAGPDFDVDVLRRAM